MAKYIEYETLLQSIRNGAGTEMQKIFAECCVYASGADMVEVVRCKDCKYYGFARIAGESYKTCKSAFGMSDCCANDFCSYGEGKEE